ncbi:MAG: hypothetical protein QOE26_855 [Verrucomicrobiota bacterium]
MNNSDPTQGPTEAPPTEWLGFPWSVVSVVSLLACPLITTIVILWLRKVGGTFYVDGIGTAFGAWIGVIFMALWIQAKTTASRRAAVIAAWLSVLIALLVLCFLFWPTLRVEPRTYFSSDPNDEYIVKERSGRSWRETASELGQARWAKTIAGSLTFGFALGSIAVTTMIRNNVFRRKFS